MNPNWNERLQTLESLAAATGVQTVAEECRVLRARLQEGRFFVACLGQFKRGKSTLVNALLGAPVLPSGVAPVTSVVTVVRFGAASARVRTGEAAWQDVALDALADFVSEASNPENRKNVTRVEVTWPSPLLEKGLCLVDTPGLGSVFAGNARETRAFVPQVDAALVVVGSDPPISGEELEMLAMVAAQVPDVLLVLNKADRVSEDERRQAREFTSGVVQQRVPSVRLELFETAALRELQVQASEYQWPSLVSRLKALADAGSNRLVTSAAQRGLHALAGRLHRQLAARREALVRPLDESQARLVALRRCLAHLDQALVELAHLFNAEQEKLDRRFESERRRFVENVTGDVERSLASRLRTANDPRGPALRAYALDQAQELVEAVVAEWLSKQRPAVEADFASVTRRFVSHANAWLGALGTEAPPLELDTALTAKSRYVFLSLMRLTSPPPWLWLADWLSPRRTLLKAAQRAGMQLARRLLEVNSHRVTGDFAERIIESRRGVEAALRRHLTELATTAEAAISHARELQAVGRQAVEDELAALGSHQELLLRLAA